MQRRRLGLPLTDGVKALLNTFVVASVDASPLERLLSVADLDLALRYANRVLWMDEGRIVADGTPEDTFNSERLRRVFGIQAEISRNGASFRLDILGPA